MLATNSSDLVIQATQLTIVISTGERSAMVYDCLRSMQDIRVPIGAEVVIVDAGRRDPVDETRVRALWENSSVIHYPEANLTKQRNVGTRAGRGEFICFIDDDTLLQPGWWPGVVAPFADPKVAVVAGAVWCNPSPDFTDKPGGFVSWLGIPSQVTHRSRNAPRDVEWPVGCNMAFRKSVWSELGGLSELYGFYDEDIDFGLRVRRAGYRVVFQPEAAVYHYCNLRPKVPMTKQKAFLQGRNRCMLLVRNYGLSLRLLLYLLTAPWIRFWELTWPVLRLWFTNYGHFGAYLAGTVTGFIAGLKHPVRYDGGNGTEQDSQVRHES